MEKTHSKCVLQIRFVFCSLFAVRGGDSSWNLSKLCCASYENTVQIYEKKLKFQRFAQKKDEKVADQNIFIIL